MSYMSMTIYNSYSISFFIVYIVYMGLPVSVDIALSYRIIGMCVLFTCVC